MLTERKLRREWVESVVRSPEWIEPDPRDPRTVRAFGRIAEAAGRVLRVVYSDKADVRIVVSAHFDRNARRSIGSRR